MAEKSCHTRHLSTGMVLLVAYTDKELLDSLKYVITHNDLFTSRPKSKHPQNRTLGFSGVEMHHMWNCCLLSISPQQGETSL